MNDRRAADTLSKFLGAVRRMRAAQKRFERTHLADANRERLDEETTVDALVIVVDQDPPEAAQRNFSDLFDRPAAPPPPKPSEFMKRDRGAARREALKRKKKIVAGMLAEGFTEREADERGEEFVRRFLSRCGV